MMIASLLAYTAAILNLALGIRVFQANRHASANRIFLIMCGTLVFWGIGYAFMFSASSAEEAMHWRVFSAIGWCSFYSIFLLFAIHFTSYNGWLAKPAIKRFIHVPALVFFLYNTTLSPESMTRSEWGWVYLYSKEVLWQSAFIVYYTSYVMTGFWLIYRWGKQAENTRTKRQAQIIVRTMLSVYVLAIPFDTYLPLLGYPVLPIAILLSTIFTVGISYAITRYKLLSLNFDTAGDHILQKMIDPVLLVGTDTVIREVNASFLELTGFLEKELIGQHLSIIIDDHTGNELERLIASKPEGKKSEVLLTTQTPMLSVPCLLSSKTLYDEFGDTLGLIVLLHDIADQKRYEKLLKSANDELEAKVHARTSEIAHSNRLLQQEVLVRTAAETQAIYSANFDMLTGLPNRRQFCEKANAAIAKAAVFGDTLAVVFFDLDNFKTLNDSFGHLHGDKALEEVAARMRSVIRKSDVLARIGGDEFLLLMDELDQNGCQKTVAKHVERFKQLFEKPFFINGRESFLTVSMGISFYPDDGSEADTLIKNADIAMYDAKRNGKNNYRFSSAMMKQDVIEKNRIRNNLFRAIEKGEMELYYQPQINTNTRRISGIEALLRWRMNQGELIPPSQFIPIAEETGLIVPIGNWVMNKALSQLSRWHEQGFSQLTMAVNLSARQLREPTFSAQVKSCIEQGGFNPKYIEFEITESIAFTKDDAMVSLFDWIKRNDIAISIDDFGTDYSSFMTIKTVSVDRLKIAQPFISGIGKNRKDEAIVSSIIELAHKLKLNVIAEGVETAEEFDYLLQKGCDAIQGYFFHHPMTAEEMGTVLQSEAAKS